MRQFNATSQGNIQCYDLTLLSTYVNCLKYGFAFISLISNIYIDIYKQAVLHVYIYADRNLQFFMHTCIYTYICTCIKNNYC